MKQTEEFFANELVKAFPKKKEALLSHYEKYDELLGHIFFADEIKIPLSNLLIFNKDVETIKKYCAFIEKMWINGTDEVVNIVDVSILEPLSDNENAWNNFAKYISNDFIKYINTDLLVNNLMMYHVDKLNYN